MWVTSEVRTNSRCWISMRCLYSITTISLRVFLINVQLNGVKRWLYVRVVVLILMEYHVLLNYQLLCWNLERLINWRKLCYIRWFMLFCLLPTLELVLMREDMGRSSKILWKGLMLLLALTLLFFIVLMIKSMHVENMCGDAMDLAGCSLLFMGMLGGLWTGNLNLLIVGLGSIRLPVEAILKKFVGRLSWLKKQRGRVRRRNRRELGVQGSRFKITWRRWKAKKLKRERESQWRRLRRLRTISRRNLKWTLSREMENLWGIMKRRRKNRTKTKTSPCSDETNRWMIRYFDEINLNGIIINPSRWGFQHFFLVLFGFDC